MKKQSGLIGPIMLGVAIMATVGLSGDLAVAQSVTGIIDSNNIQILGKPNPCGPITGTLNRCRSVPEPASLILLGAGLAGLGIWKRKFMKR